MSGFDDLDGSLGDNESEQADEEDGSAGRTSQTEQSEQSEQSDGRVESDASAGPGGVERSDLPYKFRRDTVKDERDHVDLFVLSETDGLETDAVRDLEDELGDSLSVIDAREAIYRAGLMNLDDALGVLYGWGYE